MSLQHRKRSETTVRTTKIVGIGAMSALLLTGGTSVAFAVDSSTGGAGGTGGTALGGLGGTGTGGAGGLTAVSGNVVAAPILSPGSSATGGGNANGGSATGGSGGDASADGGDSD